MIKQYHGDHVLIRTDRYGHTVKALNALLLEAKRDFSLQDEDVTIVFYQEGDMGVEFTIPEGEILSHEYTFIDRMPLIR